MGVVRIDCISIALSHSAPFGRFLLVLVFSVLYPFHRWIALSESVWISRWRSDGRTARACRIGKISMWREDRH